MGNVEWLIKYEGEGSKLDFKREPYHKEKYSDLIKDIMSMANTPIAGKGYIIFGVKDKPDGTKEFYSIPKESIVDQATYQQIIRENVEPNIEFSYYSIEIDGNLFGIIEIDEVDNPPFMMKKDYKGLKKGDCFIRRGTQQERITRRDLDDILEYKSKNQFNNKVQVGFNKTMESKLNIKAVENINLPSDNAKETIESILRERKQNAMLYSTALLANKAIYKDSFEPRPYEVRSTEKLEGNLKNVKKDYAKDDWHYIGEELSQKINLLIRNEGQSYLEDASLVLRIPNDSIRVMEKIHEKPQSNFGMLATISSTSYEANEYPRVTNEERFFIIEEDIGDIKHHQNTVVFDVDLRVYFGKISKNKTYTWYYTIFAKNLSTPIEGELIVEVS